MSKVYAILVSTAVGEVFLRNVVTIQKCTGFPLNWGEFFGHHRSQRQGLVHRDGSIQLAWRNWMIPRPTLFVQDSTKLVV